MSPVVAMDCGIFECREEYHVACVVCGQPVCLGGLSDYQRERTLWRARADRKPITHGDCAIEQRSGVAA